MKKIYLSFIFASVVLAGNAQNEFFMQTGSAVTVQSGALLFVKGEVIGQGTADMNNSGLITIATNSAADGSNPNGKGVIKWASSDAFSPNGTVRFINAGNGIIEGSSNGGGGAVEIGTLESKVRSITGGINEANLTINQNIVIKTSLSIDSGKIYIPNASHNLYIDNDLANAVTSTTSFGIQNSNFVVGKLRRKVTASRTYQFPIGTDSEGYNLSEIITKSGFPNTDITGSFTDYGSTEGTTRPLFNDYQELLNPSCDLNLTNVQWLEMQDMVSDFGIWNMTSTASGTNIYDARFYPNLSSISNLTNFVFLKMIKAPDGTSFGTDWSTFVAASGDKCAGVNVANANRINIIGGTQTAFIPMSTLGSFSGFGIGGGAGTGLPVELVNIQADPIDNKYIKISWTTATEINNSGFEVLRSEDGINFINIGWVNGNGNSSAQIDYSHDDIDVEANKMYYYRLRQVDYDGQSELTNIVSAMITDNAVFVISEFMPNPTQNTSSFTVVTSETRDINLVVYNTLGQIISNENLTAEPAKTNKYSVNLAEMASGTYYAVITTGEHTFNKKIVVSR